MFVFQGWVLVGGTLISWQANERLETCIGHVKADDEGPGEYRTPATTREVSLPCDDLYLAQKLENQYAPLTFQ